jgi:hypothetical protein
VEPKPIEIVTNAGKLNSPRHKGEFGREARNGPGGYAPGHDADVGPHPNRFEPRGVISDIAIERSFSAYPKLARHSVFASVEDINHRNCFPT